jgi:hypothetical protein
MYLCHKSVVDYHIRGQGHLTSARMTRPLHSEEEEQKNFDTKVEFSGQYLFRKENTVELR